MRQETDYLGALPSSSKSQNAFSAFLDPNSVRSEPSSSANGEALPHSVTETLDGARHVSLRGGGIGGAEEEAARRLILLGAEPRAADG